MSIFRFSASAEPDEQHRPRGRDLTSLIKPRPRSMMAATHCAPCHGESSLKPLIVERFMAVERAALSSS